MRITSPISLSSIICTIVLILGCTVEAEQLDTDQLGLTNEYSRRSNASLLWGPYSSGLYVGIRPRIAHSLLAGLMWYNSDNLNGIQNIRHACDVNDDIHGYGWTEYDPRLGGRQEIHDTGHKVDITTEFIKNELGEWVLRVKGKPKNALSKTSIVFYAGLEGTGSLDLKSQLTPKGIDGSVRLSGVSPELGGFDLFVSQPKSNKFPVSSHDIEKNRPSDKSHYASLNVPDGKTWMARDIFLTLAQDSVNALQGLYDDQEPIPPWSAFALLDNDKIKGNLHYIQRAYLGEFQFDVSFIPASSSRIPSKYKNLSDLEEEQARLAQDTSDKVDQTLSVFESKFDKAFTFHPPFDTKEFKQFGKEMFSNLVGGIGYFYGKQLVDRSAADEYLEDEEQFWESAADKLKAGITNAVEEGPFELFTCVPSRPFFPRGFYWDEGFHLLPVLDYDTDLAMEIIKSWFALVDEDGWIAREQILGEEARFRVPKEFVVQYPHYANPPTLMMLFSNIVQKVANYTSHKGQFEDFKQLEGLEGLGEGSPYADYYTNEGTGMKLGHVHLESPELLFKYVEEIYPKLQLHYEWFRSTQKGDIKEWDREAFSKSEGYRWRGRTPDHCLTSGLDDYPRASTPHTGELHVDLLSWIGMMTRSMKDLASVLGKTEDVEIYQKREYAIIRNLDELHWSDDEQAYCDATIDNFEESTLVCHKGYVSILPFALKLVEADSAHLLPILKLLRDPDELWTSFGIASLSKSDKFFGVGEDYWRGSIWMCVNQLVLDALQYYHSSEKTGDAEKQLIAEIYKDLRFNLVQTVYDNWKETGFAWEHYDAKSGAAVGAKHFHGWTSLVVEFMAMPETLGSV